MNRHTRESGAIENLGAHGSSFMPWVAAAAILLTTVVSLFVLRAPAGRRPSGVIQSHFLESGFKAGNNTPVRVPRSETGFHLVLRVDVDPDQFPLRLDVMDEEGLTTIQERGISVIYRDAYLFFHASREDFPNGTYVIQVAPESDPADGQKFRIQVDTAN